MATTSNAGSSMSFSNLQRGTRGMSASDWIRMKRINGAKLNAGLNYPYSNGLLSPTSSIYNKDIAPPQFNQTNYSLNGAINVFPTAGGSKIRRPASNWTDFIASQTADYITYSQAATTGTSIQQTKTTICSCVTVPVNTKQGICTNCNGTTHVRIM